MSKVIAVFRLFFKLAEKQEAVKKTVYPRYIIKVLPSEISNLFSEFMNNSGMK